MKRKLPTIYSSSSEEEDQPSTSQSKKIKTNVALQFLIHEELDNDTSDESFKQENISAESEIIPPTPLKTRSIMQGKFDAKNPSEKAEVQRSAKSGETKVSSSKQDHSEVEDEEKLLEEDESQREECSGEEDDDEE